MDRDAVQLGRHSVLPYPVTTLVGRDRDIERLSALLMEDTVRLVTITGVGGIGKTRVAIEVARSISGLFTNGVVLVPLAQITDPAMVGPAIADALGIPESEEPADRRIADWLQAKRLLLVLDNFEHLTDEAGLPARLLSACTGLSILITSRIPLRLLGEWIHRLDPLPTDERNDPERQEAAPSVQLFAARARASQQNFVLSDENVERVAAICQHAGGIPLAIELAAAQLRYRSLDRLFESIEQQGLDANQVLRDLPDRHRSMQATMAWSYRLLNDTEQSVLRRLAVFRGDFTVADAGALCVDVPALSPEAVEGVLDALVDHALLQPEQVVPVGEPRVLMLEPIRDFALEQLRNLDEEHEARDAHVALFCGRIAQERSHWGSQHLEKIKAVELDRDNYHAALRWCVESGRAELGLRMATRLPLLLWSPRGRFREQQYWLSQTLAIEGDAPPSLRAEALSYLGYTEAALGDLETGERLGQEALTVALTLGEPLLEVRARNAVGAVALARNDLERTREQFTSAQSAAELSGEPYAIWVTRLQLAELEVTRGTLARARTLIPSLIDATATLAEPRSSVDTAAFLATWHRLRGDHDRAAALEIQVLRQDLEWGAISRLASSLESAAFHAAATGNIAAQGILQAASNRLQETSGLAPTVATRAALARREEPGFAEAWKAGNQMPTPEAVDLAIMVVRVPPRRISHERAPFDLTAREREVLRELATGVSNREIADRLSISVPTVKVHIRSIFGKIGVDSRAAATAFALSNDLS